MTIKVEKRQTKVEYLLSFGDSQKPETFRFTEAEMKLLYKKIREALYGPVNMP